MHLVTYDTRFASVSEAAYKVDGLAVLGFFIEVPDINILYHNTGDRVLLDLQSSLRDFCIILYNKLITLTTVQATK